MWNLNSDERLRHWRHFRKEIGTKSLESALKDTVNLWSYAPYVSHYLHPLDISNWPDPWTLVHENCYCDLAKSLGMLYTLYLSDHYKNGIKNLEIRIYEGNLDRFNTVWVNGGKYILNLEFNTVVNKSSINNDLKLESTVSIDQLKLDLQ